MFLVLYNHIRVLQKAGRRLKIGLTSQILQIIVHTSLLLQNASDVSLASSDNFSQNCFRGNAYFFLTLRKVRENHYSSVDIWVRHVKSKPQYSVPEPDFVKESHLYLSMATINITSNKISRKGQIFLIFFFLGGGKLRKY